MNLQTLKKVSAGLICHRHWLGVLICMALFARPGYPAPISADLAHTVAANFLNHVGTAHTMASTEAVASGGQGVGYLVHLSPRGYILVAGDDIRVPVKGYSLSTVFYDLPEAYRENLLRELEIPAPSAAKSLSVPATDATNAPYWEFLVHPGPPTTAKAGTLGYTPDTFLLTTRWNQGYPYNKLNPTVDGELTLTGCTQTAVAQVMRYHAHPAKGSGVFTYNWHGQILTAAMNRPFNWLSMPDAINGSVPVHQQDEVAALMRDLAILNNANFGVKSTSTSFDDWEFERAFGYAPIEYKTIDDPDFFFTIKNEIDSLRPVLLRIPNHLTVADGYSSDASGTNIHVNMGWGGAWDDYYYLDQTIVAGGYSFPPDNAIYYNIRPCQGDECDPYPPLGDGQPPAIASALPDMIIDRAATVRIDAADPDGDTVTLSASSSCNGVQAEMDGNLLTLTPLESDVFCEVSILAQSHDGTTSTPFKVLSLDEKVYLGTRYDIGGQFSDVSEVDTYRAYLDGEITIAGNRGYSNQAFYVWINDPNGNTVIGPSNEPVAGNLAPGVYTIAASLTSGSYYPYDEDYSGYILSVVADELDYTVADLAASRGISLTACGLQVEKTGSGAGSVTSVPAGIDCGADCSAPFACGTEVTLTAEADATSMFTGWSGDCTGDTASVSVMIDGERQCTATFEADVDRDAMPDLWETANGLDPTVDDADGDRDGDGVSNIDEYRRGTDPDSPARPAAMPWIPLLLLDE
jgi:hypothetical protein